MMKEGAHAPPLLKWPGGKRALLSTIAPILPTEIRDYYEPFLGGAALFFATDVERAFLSDTNGELINLYTHVRDRPSALIAALKRLKNSEADYYAIRAKRPRTEVTRAARLLYLTTLAFNGIHRVNLNGEFNVPYGWKTHLNPSDGTKIHQASERLQGARLQVRDFEVATKRAAPGALIYFDPPYTVAHDRNGFVKYNERIFSWDDQVRLARHARRLSDRGCHVVVSNASHESVRALYEGFVHVKVDRFSRIASASQYRKKIVESIYHNCAKQ